MTLSLGSTLPTPGATLNAPTENGSPALGAIRADGRPAPSFQKMLDALGHASSPPPPDPSRTEGPSGLRPLLAEKTLEAALSTATTRPTAVPGAPNAKGKAARAPALKPDLEPGAQVVPTSDPTPRPPAADLSLLASMMGGAPPLSLSPVTLPPPSARSEASPTRTPSSLDVALDAPATSSAALEGLALPADLTANGRDAKIDVTAPPVVTREPNAQLSAAATVVPPAQVRDDRADARATRSSSGTSPAITPPPRQAPTPAEASASAARPATHSADPQSDGGTTTRSGDAAVDPHDDSSRTATRPHAEKSPPRGSGELLEPKGMDRTGDAESRSSGPVPSDPTVASAGQAVPLSVHATGDAANVVAVSGNSLTLVAPSVGGMTPPASRTEAPATLAGANLAVIHLAAHGVIDTPELGRVSVTARDADLGVDVQIVAETKATADVLLPHAGAMEADVRVANVSVHRLEISSGAPHGDSMSGREGALGGDSNPNGTGERRTTPRPLEPSPTAQIPPARVRVRIVL